MQNPTPTDEDARATLEDDASSPAEAQPKRGAPAWLELFGRRRSRRRHYLFFWCLLVMAPWLFATWTDPKHISFYRSIMHKGTYPVAWQWASYVLVSLAFASLGYWTFRPMRRWRRGDDFLLLNIPRYALPVYFATCWMAFPTVTRGSLNSLYSMYPVLVLVALWRGPRFVPGTTLRLVIAASGIVVIVNLLQLWLTPRPAYAFHVSFGLRDVTTLLTLGGLIVPGFVGYTLLRDLIARRQWRKRDIELTLGEIERLRIDYGDRGLRWLPYDELATVGGFHDRPVQWLDDFLSRANADAGRAYDEASAG